MSRVTKSIKTLHDGCAVPVLIKTFYVSCAPRTSHYDLSKISLFGTDDLYVIGRSGPLHRFRCGHFSQMGSGVNNYGTIVLFTKEQKTQREECADCLF